MGTMRLAFCGNLSNGYFHSVFEGVKGWLAENPAARLLDWNGSHEIPFKALPYLRPGAILLGPDAVSEIPPGNRSVPMVGYTNRVEADPVPLVVNDDQAVGREAAQALLDAGYRHIIAIISEHPTAQLRMSGFEELMRSHERPIRRHLAEVRQPRSGESFVDVLAEYEVSYHAFACGIEADSGIFCPLSAQVPHLLALLEETGKPASGGDPGIVVGDLLDSGVADRGLAHVRLDGQAIGRRACVILSDWVRSGQPPGLVRLEIPPEGVEWGRSLRKRDGGALLDALTSYCLPRLAEPVRVSEVARQLGLSRRSLELKLRTLGLPSPYEHLTALRLRKGEELLRQSDLSIERVAEQCGFADTRSFTRRFRERHGCPPSQFRKFRL
jgi:AraC-like DNA-binding protein